MSTVEHAVKRYLEAARRIVSNPYVDSWLYEYAEWLLSHPDRAAEVVALRANICRCYLCRHARLVGFDAVCSLGLSEDKCTWFEPA